MRRSRRSRKRQSCGFSGRRKRNRNNKGRPRPAPVNHRKINQIKVNHDFSLSFFPRLWIADRAGLIAALDQLFPGAGKLGTVAAFDVVGLAAINLMEFTSVSVEDVIIHPRRW